MMGCDKYQVKFDKGKGNMVNFTTIYYELAKYLEKDRQFAVIVEKVPN